MADIDCPELVLVIAGGNRLREDEAVAWHILEGLRSLKPRPGLPPLKLRHATDLVPEMAECVSKAQGVIFVEARRDGRPGEVRCDEIAPSAASNPLAPSLSSPALLLLAEQLYGRAPKAVVLTVGGECFGMGGELSPAVRRALPRAIRAVIRRARVWAVPAPPSSTPA